MVQIPYTPAPTSELPSEGNVLNATWQPETPDWDMLDEEWLSDEPDLETDFHRDQIYLLLQIMKWHWRNRNDVYCSGNTTVYYDQSQRTNRNFNEPDVYVVLGADPHPRNSWMVWREGGKYPNVVIELLSDSTATVDRTTKKDLYQNVWRLPEYFWFHPRTQEFRGFRLIGTQYEAIVPTDVGFLWSEQLALFLGLQEGVLRLFTADGERILLREEEEALQRQQAQQQVEQERQQKEQAQQQVEQERQQKEQAQQQVEQERQQKEQAQRQVEQERQQKEQAQRQVEQERQQKEQAQQQVEQERQQRERLAARLRQLGINPENLDES